MSSLKVGFSRVDVTPMMGIDISGYFVKRLAEGILDPLYANTVAFRLGDECAVMVCIDNCGIKQDQLLVYRKRIADKIGIPVCSVLISCTHTHTGPAVNMSGELADEYKKILGDKLEEGASLAFADLKDAKMGYGVGNAPGIAFVRRFRMKDGSIRTNPGVDNPDIVAPIGDVDERVNVLRFDREGADSVVIVNFGCHPDVVGGNLISADWPGFVRNTVEKAIGDVKCAFFNGAEGDINHVNVHPTGGFLNDMFMDFDDVARGYGHARYMGRVVAAGVLQAYDKVKYVEVDSLRAVNVKMDVPSNKPDEKDLPEAYRIKEMHESGRDDELPYKGMMLTTVVAEALRMVRLENAPETFDMTLSGIRLGPVAIVGIPGEPFLGIGRGIKETEGFELIMPICCANGYEGYFPMRDSYDEGGYEARSSNFRAGVAEFMISEAKKMLSEL